MNQRIGQRKLNAAKPAWTPFEKGTLATPSMESMRAQAVALNIPLEEVIKVHEDISKNDRVFVNSIYQVNVRKNRPIQEGWPDMMHLSIKRRDKAVIHDWRDLQRIKNELVGPEYEAIELYPAEDRLVDSANQYHLWLFMDPKFRLNVGFKEGRLVTDKTDGTNTKQRPLKGD